MYSAGMRMEAGIVAVVGLVGDGVAGALLEELRVWGERKVEEKRKTASEVLLAAS